MVETQVNFKEAKMEIVKEFFVSNGGHVIVYLVTPQTILEEFYVVSYDNGYNEVAWGLGHTIEQALKNAAVNYNAEDEDNYNPFEEVLLSHGGEL